MKTESPAVVVGLFYALMDKQINHVYKSDRDFYTDYRMLIPQYSVLSEVQRLVDLVIKRPIFKNIYQVKLLATGERPMAHPGRNLIQLPLPTNTLTVLHELAHLVVSDPKLEPHGIEFCRVYLSLIRDILSKELAAKMVLVWRKNKVTFLHKK